MTAARRTAKQAADDRPPRRRSAPQADLKGRLATQTGRRTHAPMWPRPLFSLAEWSVYTALWSWPVDALFPTHQELADAAWVERSTVVAAIRKFDELELLVREERFKPDSGMTDSNAYYLVEVCPDNLAKRIAELKVARTAEQDDKRKARKKANRRSAARTAARRANELHASTDDGAQGGGAIPVAPPSTGGGATGIAPPGSDGDSTPGCYPDSTHLSLGVTPVSKGTVVTTSPPNPPAPSAPPAPDDAAPEPLDAPPPESHSDSLDSGDDQEWVMPRDFWPMLDSWEWELHAACLRVRAALTPQEPWNPRFLRQAIGSPPVRERRERDPEVVRVAFMLGARCLPDPDNGEQGTASPRRLVSKFCPHWGEAEQLVAQARAEGRNGPLADETVGVVSAGDAEVPADDGAADPAGHRVPAQALPVPVSPAAPDEASVGRAAVQSWREQHDTRRAARKAAEAAEAAARAERLQGLFGEVDGAQVSGVT